MSVNTYKTDKRSVSLTRPANTTAYAVGQVVSGGALIAIPTFDRAAYLRRLKIIVSPLATAITLRLHLFKSDPSAIVTTIADQSTFALPAAAFSIYEGFIDTSVTLNGGLGIGTPTTITNFIMPQDGDPGVMYGVLVTQTVFTPSSAAVVSLDFYYESAN